MIRQIFIYIYLFDNPNSGDKFGLKIYKYLNLHSKDVDEKTFSKIFGQSKYHIHTCVCLQITSVLSTKVKSQNSININAVFKAIFGLREIWSFEPL